MSGDRFTVTKANDPIGGYGTADGDSVPNVKVQESGMSTNRRVPYLTLH